VILWAEGVNHRRVQGEEEMGCQALSAQNSTEDLPVRDFNTKAFVREVYE
jgi:hypothetical protein